MTFQDMIGLLPLLILCVTTLCVLLFVLFYRCHCVTFFITIFGVTTSFVSLYIVWKYEVHEIANLFYIDKFSILCMVLVLLASFVTSIVSYMWLAYNRCVYSDEFYLLLLILTIGAVIVVNTSHLVMLFFGIELVSLPLFGIIGYVTARQYVLEATIKYVVLSAISTAFLLFGIALVYAETACLSFIDLFAELVMRANVFSQSMILMLGISMMLVGFGFKLSLVPFHLWTADVYQGASEIAGMCLATINKISVFSILVRFFLLFPASYNKIIYILVIISCVSMLFGTLMAIKQDNIKRILAYSSVTHTGYLLVGVIGSMKQSFPVRNFNVLNTFTDGIETISICLVNYCFATLGAFIVFSLVFCIYYYDKNEDPGILNLYRGLFWKDPILSIAFTIIILALAGVPATLGFICKFYLIIFGVERELWWCVAFMVFCSGVSVLYYSRAIIILYLSPLPSRDFYVRCSNGSFAFLNSYYNNKQLVMVLCALCIVLVFSVLLAFFGIFPQCLLYLLSLI